MGFNVQYLPPIHPIGKTHRKGKNNNPVTQPDDNGFEWIDIHDWEQSTISCLRKGSDARDIILTVCNFMPLFKFNYRFVVPRGGFWEAVLNSDAIEFGGSGHGNFGGAEAVPVPSHGRYSSLSLTLPPLGILFFWNKGNTE